VSTVRRSLRSVVALRIGVALLLAAAIAVLIAFSVYQSAFERAVRARSALLMHDYAEKLVSIGQGWEDRLMREKAQLEFSRLLENPQGRWDRLRAYLAAQGETSAYSGLTLCDRNGRLLFRQGVEMTCRGSIAPVPTHNAYRYFADAHGQLLLDLNTPIWLGPDGTGFLHLALPLDHAMLWRMAFSGTDLFIEWQGQIRASSLGESGLTQVLPVQVGQHFDRDGNRYELRRTDFPAGSGGPLPQLLILTQVAPPFSVAESAGMGVAIFSILGLLLVLALQGWLAALLPRIESLSRGARLFAREGKPSDDLARLLQRSVGRDEDELSEVALSIIDMVAALNLRDHERQESAARLGASERRFREVAEFASAFVWEIDKHLHIVYASDGAAEIFGVPVELLTGRQLLDFVTPAAREPIKQQIDLVAQAGEPFRRFEIGLLRPDGTMRRVAFSGTPVVGARGRRTGSYRGMAEDVTQRRIDEERLRLAAKVFESSAQAILVTDAGGKIVSVNPAFTAITGYLSEEAIGANPRKFASGRHDAAFYAAMWGALRREGIWAGEVWDRRKSGEVYPKWLTINAVQDAATGAVSHYVGIFSDISEQKENVARIEHLAYHDPLTGLPNRHALYARLDQSIAEARRNEQMLAVMFIDLDRFKTINDSLGHDVGDQLLIAVSLRLRSVLRESDTVARLGGDEFVIVVTGVIGPEDAARVAEKVIAQVGKPLVLPGHVLHTSPSIGIGLFPHDGGDRDTLMKNADAAMYYAKQHGRNAFHFFAADMNAAAAGLLLLETQLRGALDRGEFFLVFEPQVDLATGRPLGVEVQARWRHPDRGTLEPATFLPVAEESGLVVQLGAWVVAEACRQARAWDAAGLPPLRISVSLSAQQLKDRNLAHHVTEVLQRTGLPAERLEFEIADGMAAEDIEHASETLSTLQALGVHLALGNFGAGYAPLSSLRRLSFCRFKIAASFVADLETNPRDVAIAAGIVALARELTLPVTAEGIETPAQLTILRNVGCSEGQGAMFAKPLTAEALRDYLAPLAPLLIESAVAGDTLSPHQLH
jgi:diguanylate cyclase (GGDEF)-like protein/PAS domain S-box-containing protein